MKLRIFRLLLFGFTASLLIAYVRILKTISLSPSSSSSSLIIDLHLHHQSSKNVSSSISMVGKTKIVTFCDFEFRSVGIKWYQRMTTLGYDNHVVVATDTKMANYLATKYSNFRYEVELTQSTIPKEYQSKSKSKQDRVKFGLLLSVRWKFVLEQLKRGTNVLLTDVDNIFSRYISIKDEIEDNDSTIDVWHAYATKFPPKIYKQQGFTVCGGMSWWRASVGAIRFLEMFRERCPVTCDDQRVMNNLLIDPALNMTWFWTQKLQDSRITSATTTDENLLGLPTLSILGTSNITGHKARVWDRNFALRGRINEPCPNNNWVSMPIVEASSRARKWIAKLDSFDNWDKNCGITLN